MAKGLSGSTIKSWFQYRCERKTRYEIMEPSELAAVPVAKDDREKPWAVLGVDYEERVVRRLARETGVLRPSLGDTDGLRDDVAAAFLRGRGAAEYAAQLKLRPRTRPAFLSGNLSLRRSFADLVRRDTSQGSPVFRVIDIKATRSARAFHKTQVAFYALLLEAILKENGIAGRVDAFGEIWRIPDDGDAEGDRWQTDVFLLEPYSRLVADFCGTVLPQIADKTVDHQKDETFFHVYFKCEQCSYLPHCIQKVSADRLARDRDVSAVAGLSHEAKRSLRRVGVSTVAQLAEMGAGIGQMDGAGWSLARRAETLIARAKALRDDDIGTGPEPHSFLMPPRCDACLYLIADHDPVDDGLVTLGYLYVRGEERREVIEVLPSADRQGEADALVRIFAQLVADLTAIDAHNAALAADDPAALFAHIFLYEPAEAMALQEAVGRHLDDPRVRTGLLDMVRLFPPDEVVPEPEFRGMQHLPATALRSVVEQLFAVPVTVSYDLRQVSGALERAGKIARAYDPAEAFIRPFSSLLSIEVSRALREGRRGSVAIDEVRADVSDRLRTTHDIAEWLRAEHRRRLEATGQPMLRLNKSPFRLQATFNPLAADDLDVLRAFELLENRSGLLDALIKLAQPPRVRRDTGRAIGAMRLIGAYPSQRNVLMLFKMPPDAMDADLSAGAFGLVLSDGEPDFVLEPRQWPRLACQMLDPKPQDTPDLLRVRVFKGVFDGPAFKELMRRAGKDDWWLDQTFVDLNSAKAENYLTYLAAGVAA
ncbi:MAG: hypothetical protein E6G92_12520 [Alphaproteobacteria bacterium]|nr:MAG: hypothetical protein E6G92_12520 [Alphaproteobacteria bacterium]